MSKVKIEIAATGEVRGDILKKAIDAAVKILYENGINCTNSYVHCEMGTYIGVPPKTEVTNE